MSFDYEGLAKHNAAEIAKAKKEHLESEREEIEKDVGPETLKAIRGMQ